MVEVFGGKAIGTNPSRDCPKTYTRSEGVRNATILEGSVRRVTTLMDVVGAGLIVAGVAFVFWPAALVVAGVAVLVASWQAAQ